MAFVTRNGLPFDSRIPWWQAELMCWKHWREPEYGGGKVVVDPHQCFLRAMRHLLTSDEWKISPWTELHVHDWTHENDIIVWGGASCEKTNTYGLMACVDWLIDPGRTITLLVSTTLQGLMKRTFESVVRYHSILKSRSDLNFEGKLAASAKAITQDGTDEVRPASGKSIKMGIWGVALKDGPVQDSVSKIRGAHAEYVNYIYDELSQAPEAAMAPELHANLLTGAKFYRFAGLTNIDDFDDVAGRHSVPAGGWQSVDIESESWRTASGRFVRRLDGLKSPAIVEPDGEKKYPHLLNRRQYDAIVRQNGGNPDAPAVWRQVRAWPPAVSSRPTPLTLAEAQQWGMTITPASATEPVRWLAKPTPAVGVDPGFGGDDCDVQVVWVGTLSDSRKAILFDAVRKVPIMGSKKDRTVLDQIYEYCMPLFQTIAVRPEHVGFDDSGPQSVADYFARLWSPAVRRYSFGAKPSEKPVSHFDTRLCSDRYADQVTELVYLFREYGQYRQILQVPEVTLSQITRREVIRHGGRLKLLSKDDYRKATGLGSPNEMDSAAVALGVVRDSLGLAPGATEFSLNGPIESGYAGSTDAVFEDAARELNDMPALYI